jgi:photosystem II stability/assembly factor-like uncharacterized protein
MHAVDSNVVWAVVRDGIDEWGYPVQEFTHTTDGGQTWNAGTIPGCENLGCAMVFAMSDQKAYIPMFKYYNGSPQGIYVTTDGGATWSRQETALFSSSWSFPDVIHFFGQQEGVCIGDPYLQDSGLEFEIYTTTDGGESWVAVPSVNKADPLPGEDAMLSYSAVNDTLWFGTTKGRVYRSVNKGSDWTVYDVPEMAGEWVTPVFRNGSHGLVHNFFYSYDLIVSPPGTISESFDGGVTWTPLAQTGPLYWTDLAYIPGTENTWVNTGGRVVFENGCSYSSDGGHTWTAFPGTEGTKFRFMTWLDGHCGWAGGFNVSATEGGIFTFTGDISSLPSFVNPPEHVSGLAVFPNPADGQVTLRADGEIREIRLFDISGRQVYSWRTRGSQVVLDVSAFAPGYYTLSVVTEEGIGSSGVIIL